MRIVPMRDIVVWSGGAAGVMVFVFAVLCL